MARAAVLRAEKSLWKYFGVPREELQAVTKKDGTVCTVADLESEKAIREEIATWEGKYSFYGEELGGEKSAPYTILIDPLDGTSNYYRGRVDFSICVALAKNDGGGSHVIAVLTYEPATKRIWTAMKGQGAYLESSGKSIRVCVSTLPPSKGDICYDAYTNRGFALASEEQKAGILRAAILKYRKIRLLGSNVLAHALVASGNFEAAVTDAVGGPFDIAGILLVKEAGGKATNLSLTEVDVWKDSVVVSSNGIQHEELVRTLAPLYRS